MDDEKYFTFACHDLIGNNFFYTDDFDATPENVKFARKTKFEPKVLVWIAISCKGLSTPYIRPIGGPAIDSKVYSGKCMLRLKEFIDKYHAQDNYIFWPDLASCHYAKNTTS